MVVKTKLFGEIDITDDKIITFEQGMIGFGELKKFAILYDLENENKNAIRWLQSLDEPTLAFPVIDPYIVKEDYNPEVNDNSINALGKFDPEAFSVLVTISVPKDVKKMSCNLRAPIVINAETRKGAQIISETAEYPVKFQVYEILKSKKESKGAC